MMLAKTIGFYKQVAGFFPENVKPRVGSVLLNGILTISLSWDDPLDPEKRHNLDISVSEAEIEHVRHPAIVDDDILRQIRQKVEEFFAAGVSPDVGTTE